MGATVGWDGGSWEIEIPIVAAERQSAARMDEKALASVPQGESRQKCSARR